MGVMLSVVGVGPMAFGSRNRPKGRGRGVSILGQGVDLNLGIFLGWDLVHWRHIPNFTGFAEMKVGIINLQVASFGHLK